MILDDKYITKDMLVKNTYKGNYYAKKNAVMYDLQNGKQNVICFCDNIYSAQGIVEGLNLLDKLEADGAELHVLKKYNNATIQLADNNKDGKIK
jgi:hypothetical protein